MAKCYHPQKLKNTEQEFVIQLPKVIDFITASADQPYFIIAGDFNNLDTSFLQTEYGLSQITNSITHEQRALDEIFIAWPSAYTVCVVNSLLKTKHKAVFLARADEELNIGSSRKTILVYDKRQLNIDYLRHTMATFDWTPLNNSSNITEMYNKFVTAVSELIDQCHVDHVIQNNSRHY